MGDQTPEQARELYEDFQRRRGAGNRRLMGEGIRPDGSPQPEPTLVLKRFINLDTRCYQDGALPAATKELLGLTASAVLRCDDCIAYHIDRCVEAGVGDQEIMEAIDVALVVGGSIVIPHARRAAAFLDAARIARAGDAD